MNQPIYVVDGARTPFLKARNRPGPFAASDLAVQAGRELVAPTLPKTLFIFFAKFRRNESAPLALPEWEGPI